jgi:glycosyltransferase involved in cell wall biosynthesis
LLVNSVSADQPQASPVQSYHIGISWETSGAGGSARVFRDLWCHLPGQGVRFNGAVALPEDVAEQTSGTIQCFGPANAGSVSRLQGARRVISDYIHAERPDVVATHFALFAASAFDQLRQQAHVVHFHGPWAAESAFEGETRAVSFGKRMLERKVYASADRVIVLSKAFAALAVQDYKIPEEILHIIPGAVHIERFHVQQSVAEARAALGWPADRIILASVRRLVSRMGLERLITAIATLRLRHPEVLLCIVGKGRLRAELEARVAELGLEANVRFHGFVSEEQLPLVYRAANLTVVPTLALEGFGLVAAESLAAGTPCIVTPVGGLPEVVAGLNEGLVFQSAESNHIAERLDEFLSGQIALPTAALCLDHARRHFGVEQMARRTATVYADAIRNGGSK